MSLATELLACPKDARLLIVNADDFGMYRAINEAIIHCLQQGLIKSTTLMAPCSAASEAITFLKQHPEIGFGVHLSVICDLPRHSYGPISPIEKVPSLIDENGGFYALERRTEFLAQAKLKELELEFVAQIHRVLDEGLSPTHLDWHCLQSGGRPDVFEMTLELAKAYGLALRIAEKPLIKKLQNQGLVTADFEMLDSFRIDTKTKASQYADKLHKLPAGLSEWAIHPGLEDLESRTIDADWPVRKADYEFFMSEEARAIIAQEGIRLLDYRPIQKHWYLAQS